VLPGTSRVDDGNIDGRMITCVWECRDGTKACAVEHEDGGWELRVVRRGRIVAQHRCASFADLIAAAMAAHDALLFT
jgi:hypothetical protein